FAHIGRRCPFVLQRAVPPTPEHMHRHCFWLPLIYRGRGCDRPRINRDSMISNDWRRPAAALIHPGVSEGLIFFGTPEGVGAPLISLRCLRQRHERWRIRHRPQMQVPTIYSRHRRVGSLEIGVGRESPGYPEIEFVIARKNLSVALTIVDGSEA